MICIENCANKLCFDERKGVIAELKNEVRQYVYKQAPIFEMALRNEAGERIITNTCEMELAESEASASCFSCTYKNELATVKINVCAGEFFEFRLSAQPASCLVAEWINYPQIVVEDNLGKGAEDFKILWGFNEGALVDDIDFRERTFAYTEPDYPSTGAMGMYPAIVETQFMAYYNDKSGLYLAAHDDKDYLKGIDFYRVDSNAVKLQFKHFCGGNFGESFELYYPMVAKFFKGDWMDASEIYRKWFLQNRERQFVKISENKALPDWYGHSPVVVTYPVRGVHDTDIMNPNRMFPYINAMPHIERLEKELGSKIMVILMHWEGTAPWAPPYVWPPFGGENELKKFIDALHSRGDILGVYCSGIGWTDKSKIADYAMTEVFEKENLREEMCLSPRQELPYCNICPAQRVGYDLCPTRDFTKNVMKAEVEKMVSAGIDYIQLLDQNHGGTPYFCYSRKHNHPPVPGKWQVDAMKELLAFATQNDKNVLFGCESAAAESYIPQLMFSDNRFNLNYATGRPVPVYAYVFHEYINNFMGNQVCTQCWIDHEKSPINVLERLAYSFCAGDMLTLVLDQDGNINWNWGELHIDHLPDQESIKTFVKNANFWRQGYGKKYLHLGKMVRPYAVECDINRIYTTAGTYLDCDKIYTSAWESEEGGFGQVLVNYNPEPVTFKVSLGDEEFTVKYADEREDKVSGDWEVTLDRLSVVLIEK